MPFFPLDISEAILRHFCVLAGDSADQLWALLYDRLANKGISLAVLIDHLPFGTISQLLVRNKIISSTQCARLQRSLVNGCSVPEVNRLLVDMVTKKKSGTKKKFTELLVEHQPQLWHRSMHVWCAQQRKTEMLLISSLSLSL